MLHLLMGMALVLLHHRIPSSKERRNLLHHLPQQNVLVIVLVDMMDAPILLTVEGHARGMEQSENVVVRDVPTLLS